MGANEVSRVLSKNQTRAVREETQSRLSETVCVVSAVLTRLILSRLLRLKFWFKHLHFLRDKNEHKA